jgi:hypothetical protein
MADVLSGHRGCMPVMLPGSFVRRNGLGLRRPQGFRMMSAFGPVTVRGRDHRELILHPVGHGVHGDRGHIDVVSQCVQLTFDYRPVVNGRRAVSAVPRGGNDRLDLRRADQLRLIIDGHLPRRIVDVDAGDVRNGPEGALDPIGTGNAGESASDVRWMVECALPE